MEFEYQGSFYFSQQDEDEVLGLISNGFTVEGAVQEWVSGLDDCFYYEVENVRDQIISYVYSKIEKNC
jgi:hypothetical protein